MSQEESVGLHKKTEKAGLVYWLRNPYFPNIVGRRMQWTDEPPLNDLPISVIAMNSAS